MGSFNIVKIIMYLLCSYFKVCRKFIIVIFLFIWDSLNLFKCNIKMWNYLVIMCFFFFLKFDYVVNSMVYKRYEVVDFSVWDYRSFCVLFYNIFWDNVVE